MSDLQFLLLVEKAIYNVLMVVYINSLAYIGVC